MKLQKYDTMTRTPHDTFIEITMLFFEFDNITEEQIDEIKNMYTKLHKYFPKLTSSSISAIAEITRIKCTINPQSSNIISNKRRSEFETFLERELYTDQRTLKYLDETMDENDVNNPFETMSTMGTNFNKMIKQLSTAASRVHIADEDDIKILSGTL